MHTVYNLSIAFIYRMCIIRWLIDDLIFIRYKIINGNYYRGADHAQKRI
jgi:hypothetical protein